jgi:hypothetical protein
MRGGDERQRCDERWRCRWMKGGSVMRGDSTTSGGRQERLHQRRRGAKQEAVVQGEMDRWRLRRTGGGGVTRN